MSLLGQIATPNTTTPVNFDCNGRHSSTGICSVPPEILSVIFECGKDMVDVDPLRQEGRTPPKMAFEWVVSHTCSFFRDVAIGTPKLWTSLQFNGSSSLEWITECISRSGSCFLDVLIEEGEEYSMTEPAMGIITQHSFRWRSLSLSCSYESVHNPIVAYICSSPAPALRYLSLHVNDVEHLDRNIINDLTFPHIFEDGTPLLNFLRLGDWAMCLFRPPLGTIVTLHLDDSGQTAILYSTFRGIITSSPFLEHLSVYGDIIGEGRWPGRSDIIVLRKLRSLRICGVEGDIYPGILLGIDAPLLESLTLRDLHEGDLDTLWELNDNTRYSNLTQLVFCNFDLSAATYTRLFKTFRNITSFSAVHSAINRSPVTDLLSNGIVVDQNSPYFPWPRLRDIEFSFGNTNQEEQMILEVAERRQAHGYPLARFLLRVDEDDLEEIPEIVMEGQTFCEFRTVDGVWPQNRSYIDYDDTRFT